MRRVVLCATLVGAVLGASSAQAALIDPVAAGQTVYLRQTDNNGNFLPAQQGGGPFRVDLSPYDLPRGAGGDFVSFCLEVIEALQFNVPLKINQITGSAFAGGAGGGSPDPISAETSFLYNQYRRVIAGWIPPDARYADGALVQRAIWVLENEYFPGTFPGADAFILQVKADLAAAVYPILAPAVVLNLQIGRAHV